MVCRDTRINWTSHLANLKKTRGSNLLRVRKVTFAEIFVRQCNSTLPFEGDRLFGTDQQIRQESRSLLAFRILRTVTRSRGKGIVNLCLNSPRRRMSGTDRSTYLKNFGWSEVTVEERICPEKRRETCRKKEWKDESVLPELLEKVFSLAQLGISDHVINFGIRLIDALSERGWTKADDQFIERRRGFFLLLLALLRLLLHFQWNVLLGGRFLHQIIVLQRGGKEIFQRSCEETSFVLPLHLADRPFDRRMRVFCV